MSDEQATPQRQGPVGPPAPCPRSLELLGETDAAFTAFRRDLARVLAAVHALEVEGVAADTGYRSTSRLLQDHVRADRGEITVLCRYARLTRPTISPTGVPPRPSLPATAALLADGHVGEGHVRVIAAAMKRLDALPHLPPDVRTVAEEELAGLARLHTPAALAHAATVICDQLDPDGAAPTDDTEPVDELRMLHRDGVLHGKFRFVDPVAIEVMLTAIRAATPPPCFDGDPDAPGPASLESVEAGDGLGSRPLPQRQAQALRDLAATSLNRSLNHDADPEDADSEYGGLGDDGLGDDGLGDDGLGDDGLGDDDASAGGTQSGARPAGGDPGDQQPPADANARRPRAVAADTEGGDRIHVAVTIDWALLSDQVTGLGPATLDQIILGTRTLPGTAPPGTAPPGTAPLGTAPPGATPQPSSPIWNNPDPGRPRLPGLGHFGSGAPLGPETARRLACDAEIIPIVLGSRSEPLDIGRKTRVVPAAMRRALIARDRHCAFPGCRRHARRCEAHHLAHWATGGRTEINNLALLCSYHHTLVHHGGWTIGMIDGLPWFTPPRWIDITRRPRHNRPWRTDRPPAATA